MGNKIFEISGKAERLISGLSCEYAEIRLAASEGTTISLAGDEIDTFTSGDSIGGSVRVLNKGAWGFVAFNNCENIEAHLKRAVEISSAHTPHEKSRIRPASPSRDSWSTPVLEDFRNISPDEKFSLIQGYNTILRSSDFIQTTRATYRDSHTDYVFLNSEGSHCTWDRFFCGISLSSTARDGSVIEPHSDSVAGYGGFETVRGHGERAEKVTKTAVDLLKAESVPGGSYSVITNPKLSGVFIHEAFGHLSEADFIHENRRLREIMSIGKTFGPGNLNVIDDGTRSDLTGYIPFDDEGVMPEKTYLIRDGVLTGRLHSRETAAKMDEEITGNGRALTAMRQPIVRMTNTYIEEGSSTMDEIFNSVDSGIYAADVIGGQTNLEMFTFTAAYGHEIRNGRKGRMYRDIVLSGNVFTTLNNIALIGNDLRMFGGLGGCGKGGQGPLPVSFGGPHMLISDVLIGGKQ